MGSPFSGCASWNASGVAAAEQVLVTQLLDEQHTEVYSSFELLATPAAMLPSLRNATVSFTIGIPAPGGIKGKGTVSITLHSDAPALFVGTCVGPHCAAWGVARL